MKFIITESQHNRLLSEQKIYTNKREYDKALAQYNIDLKMVSKLNAYYKEGEKFFKERVEPFLNSKQYSKLRGVRRHTSTDSDGYTAFKDVSPDLRDWLSKGDPNNYTKYTGWDKSAWMNPKPKDYPNRGDYEAVVSTIGYRKIKNYPKKPIYKAPDPVKKQTPKPNPPVVNKPPIVTPPVNNTPIVTPPKKEEPIKTKFSATFGQDGKQETRYFKNFNEWKRFDDSVRGKFGYVNSKYNQSETEASILLKGVPSDWGL